MNTKAKYRKHVYFICTSAIIAALYVVLTLISAAFGLSSGVIQVRISEALCVLCCFTPAAIPGLTVGCFLANVLTTASPLDMIFGTLATLIGALGGYLLRRNKWLVTLPTVLANALIVPIYLIYGFGVELPFFYLVLTVGVGEVISATVIGTLLLTVLQRHKFKW